jgi:hypothetical protein
MCLARRNLTPKAQRFLAIGNLCLAAGLTMSVFDTDLGLNHAAIYDGLRGLLIGIALAFNFGALRMSANCRQPQP